MVRIVGKLLLIPLFIFSFFSYSAVNLQLKALSFEGDTVEQVGVGQPFILQVEVSGKVNTSKRPQIEGLDNFYVGQTGFEMRTVNGQSSIKYKYHSRVDKQGNYQIGPATIEEGGKTISSNRLALRVGEEQILKNGSVQHKKRVRKVILHLSADKEHVVIGEKIKARLRFYSLEGEAINPERMVSSDVKDLKQSKKDETPCRGTREINGDVYKYLEWTWDIFPKTVGKISLPAYRVDYVQRVDNGFFSGFSSFFNFGTERKRIYSESLHFTVDPLPEYDGVVDAVGDFRSFSAFVDRAMAKQGDGIVLTLQIEGAGDLESMDIRDLTDMQSSLKYYDSKRYILDGDDPNSQVKKKRFEFIVQGTEAGEFEIPSQTFTFFDVKKRRYKTLKTSPVIVQILPQATPKPYIPPVQTFAKDDSGPVEEEISPIDQYGAWYKTKERKIPFWMFLVLVLVPFCFASVSFARRKLAGYSAKCTPHFARKKAFSTAYKKLRFALKKENVRDIYPIFIQMFADRFLLKENEITQSFIGKKMKAHGFSHHDIDSWDIFFSTISAYVFFEKNRTFTFDKKIFDEALDWVERFKKQL